VRLWEWAVAAWNKPGAAEVCLDLQDHHGQCVALVLWRLWSAAEDRPVSEAILARAIGEARPFETDVLRPLRAARCAVGKGDLHARIHAAELAAEHDLLDRLDAATPLGGSGSRVQAAAALVDLMQAWNEAGAEGECKALRLAATLSLC
jgi:uncharacterized protein (TIGR02444 family)